MANAFVGVDASSLAGEMRAWWKYMRWVLLAQVLCTMIGFTATYYAVFVVIESKFPDEHARVHGDFIMTDNPFDWLEMYKNESPWSLAVW